MAAVDAPSGPKKRTLVAGAGWLTGIQLVSKVVEVGFLAILARLLTPADFGVIAGAMVFIQLVSLVVEIGIGATIVQLTGLTRDDLRAASTLVAINAVIYFLLAQLFAPVVGMALSIPEVDGVIRVLAFMLLLQAIGVVPEGLLTRRLLAPKVLLVQLAAKIGATLVLGIPLAWAGFGYWALVAATLGETAVKAIWLYAIERPPVRPLLTRPLAARLLRSGSGFSISRLINFAAVRGDNAVVGATLGAASLGLYSRAYNLMSVPADLYAKVADRLIFPAFAQVQGDSARLKRAFLQGLAMTATVGIPLSVMLFLTAPEVIDLVLGNQWHAVIEPFAILAIASYFRIGVKVIGSLQRALGAFRSMIWTQLVYAGLVVGGAAAASAWGITGVAAAVALGLTLFYAIMAWQSCVLARVSAKEFISVHLHGLLLGALCAAVLLAVLVPLRAAGPPSIVILLAVAAVACVMGGTLLLLRPRWLLGEVVAGLGDDVARKIVRTLNKRRGK